jgi:CubicO group peptidase (beta-lactamase class C family)
VERRFFEPDGRLRETLAEHVAAARAVAAEFKAPFVDLNAASRTLYLAYGPQAAPGLFATGTDGRIDPTHHNNAGAWLLAGLVAQGLHDAGLPVAAELRADAPRVDAAKPPALASLRLAPSPQRAHRPPAGDGRAEPAAGIGNSASGSPASHSVADPARLARIDAAIRREIEAGRLAGAVALLWRDGEPLHETVLGLARVEEREPMRRDTLFRIASMSKAVTTVAALMLYEEGHFLLRDPVSKWIPAFGRMQVAVAQPAGGAPKLEAPLRPVTVRDLLLHTAGLSYGAGPAEAAWRAAGITDWPLMQRDETLAQWVDRLTVLPLQGQPGQAFQYGYATDVLGRLVEIWSGQPLEQFVAERITGPLQMPDTHFWVPPEKAARLAHVYGLEGGPLKLQETAARSDFVNGPRKLPSGGAGLVSSAPDYARFLQMLLNGGTLDGVRLLSPATVGMMTRDHLGPRFTGDAEGAGFGFWVAAHPGTRSELASPGAWGWGSAYSPQYVVDPATRTVFVYMAQLRPAGQSSINQRVKVLARQALAR